MFQETHFQIHLDSNMVKVCHADTVLIADNWEDTQLLKDGADNRKWKYTTETDTNEMDNEYLETSKPHFQWFKN